jgi:hypothetical protein
VIAGAQLPPEPGSDASRLVVGAYASPWPGDIALVEDVTGATLATLIRSATLGELTTPLAEGLTPVWDRTNAPEIRLYGGHIASAEDEAVFAGSNRLLVEEDDGGWELIGFAEATLIGTATYRLDRLLRGLGGTDHALGAASAGNRVMVFDASAQTIALSDDRIGIGIAATAYAGRTDATGTKFDPETGTAPLLPLSPVHLKVRRDHATGDIGFSWIRRSRDDTGSWAVAEVPLDVTPESYQITVFDGAIPIRTLTGSAPTATYTTAQQTADFGGAATDFDFEIAQMSAVYGAGHPSQGHFDG